MTRLNSFLTASFAILISCVLTACGGGGDDSSTEGSSGSTGSTSSISAQTLGHSISSGVVTISAKLSGETAFSKANAGVLIGESAQPTISTAICNEHPSTISADGMFTIKFYGLHPSTTYHYRAYYYNGSAFYYGESKQFTTSASSIAAVDLGLPSGTLWANQNIGANSPQETGLYYRAGEIWPINSAKAKEFSQLLRDVNDDKDPVGDLELALLQMDAAHQFLGQNWRMPTEAEQNELKKECQWIWCDGVNEKYNNTTKLGYIVKGPNGSSIFLPATGYFDTNNQQKNETMGYYRSRLTTQEVPTTSRVIILTAEMKGVAGTLNCNEACPIRAVKIP